MAKRRKSGEPRTGVAAGNHSKIARPRPSQGKPSRAKSPGLRGTGAADGVRRSNGPRSWLGRPCRRETPSASSNWPSRLCSFLKIAPTLISFWRDLSVDARQALALLEQGLAAAERVLRTAIDGGPENRRILARHPKHALTCGCGWGCPNAYGRWAARTRPSTHLQDMLRLNPGDNQGVRLSAGRASCSTSAGMPNSTFWSRTTTSRRHSAVFKIVARVPPQRRFARRPANCWHRPGAATSSSCRCCWKSGPCDEAVPEMYSPGDRNEALLYLADFAGGWKQTPGAITWLRSTIDERQRQQGQACPSVRRLPSRSSSPACRRVTAQSGRRPSVAFRPGFATVAGWCVRGRS